jgi:hypothetical protein
MCDCASNPHMPGSGDRRPGGCSYALLRRAGLLPDVAARLSRLPHCTPAYVQAHITFLRSRREGLNHLVRRLRANEPAPMRGGMGDG